MTGQNRGLSSKKESAQKNRVTSVGSNLDHLIEQVLEEDAAYPPNVSPVKRRGRFKYPLLLCVAFLSAFFCGSLFGFLWGKSQENARLSEKLLTYEKEIFSLLDELKILYLEPKTNPPEKTHCIEPLLEDKEPAALAAKKWI